MSIFCRISASQYAVVGLNTAQPSLPSRSCSFSSLPTFEYSLPHATFLCSVPCVACLLLFCMYVCSTNNYAQDDKDAIMIIDNEEDNDEVVACTCVKSISASFSFLLLL